MDVKTALSNFKKLLKDGFETYENEKINTRNYGKVWFFGMGASAIAPLVLRSINHNIHVANTNLLTAPIEKAGKVGISYSGNTEEVLMNIERYGVDIVITSNGKLEHIAKENNIHLLYIPKGIVPRSSFAYLFASSLYAAKNLGAINSKEENEIKEKVLEVNYKKQKEKAKMLAESIEDKVLYVLADTNDYVAAYRLKTQVNENAKMFCFVDELPEANHNSLMMWKNSEVRKHIHVIIIESQDDFVKESQLYFYNHVLKGNATFIKLEESDKVKRLFELIHLGDWLSYYLGKKRNVIIEDTSIIEDLKRFRRMKK